MESKEVKTETAIWSYKYSSLMEIGYLMKDGGSIALIEKQLGEQIVKNLNTHDELVKALQDLNGAVDDYWNADINTRSCLEKNICDKQKASYKLLQKIY